MVKLSTGDWSFVNVPFAGLMLVIVGSTESIVAVAEEISAPAVSQSLLSASVVQAL